ncbi:5-amino-6-(5-phospho-D-ribitylamino)uracil phosphatase YcsE [Methanimicrococcus stummii]|uniref:Phosphoglycolate phosphatase n=1 Tax=Methanimicrococcus stummii TaxID=3028294 RepID=A0AA96V8T9_9EURY|nr:phosphoglycolate phosphatase [Methanimicrococcus sp. Es2]WNY28884.1 5-amino-6-(5-phospho-D-ribitylamino)uracil phosphatase YcsE [Methanimicrococcus sp. Es2]
MARFLGIVSDIDGTITHSDRRLSVEALRSAHMISGRIPFVLASGNTLCFTRAVSKMLGTRSPLIAENGGILLPSYDADPIMADPCRNELNAALNLLLEHFDLNVFDSRDRVTDVSFAKTISKDEILPYLSDFKNIEFVDAEYAFHLTDKNICKGGALLQMSELMGLKPKDFVAVGDSNNDIDLFRAAGLSFAVASATDAVKKEADYVLQKGYGDGFAEMVDFLIQNDWIELEDERRDFYV